MELPLLASTALTSRAPNGTTTVQKHKVRAIFRVTSFLALIAIFSVVNYLGNNSNEDQDQHRRLEDGDNSTGIGGIFQKVADPTWFLVLYVIGVLYMFLALAIVCDEYFVPALECMSGELHLNLSADISGATLMAAGGSAPELFTSFIGTFQGSEVGFGTIVGSAVFNVLFVIGMCSLLSKETLELTWWPLFRDSTYYAIGLLVLAIFVGVKGPGVVDLVEALILFLLYFGYIVLMAFNEQLYTRITGKELNSPEDKEALDKHQYFSFKRFTTYRAGLLTLLRDPEEWRRKARVSLVSKILGNAEDVFKHVDKNGDGTISRVELKECFDEIQQASTSDEDSIDEEELARIMEEIDTDRDDRVTKKEFLVWYGESEKAINQQIRRVFDKYDDDESGGINKNEFKTLIMDIEPTVEENTPELNLAVQHLFSDTPELKFDDFSRWYAESVWYRDHIQVCVEEDSKSIRETLSPPEGAGCFGIFKYLFLLPLVALLALTVPDVRRPGMDKGYACYLAFILSICWIGIYSFFMVGWAETIGETLGIDTFIMGLTFLAAGTSVPDLLSSVIVARMGKGDMAVSSSIGSNIFDILVGLPVPWLVFSIVRGESVTIGADGVWISIMILLGMLVLIIGTVHLSGWRLTKGLGYTMFFFYFCFLAQAIIRNMM
jgi:K+-dependent Na+/Ca+ exchanger-like protein